jgi:dihydrofolate reductase
MSQQRKVILYIAMSLDGYIASSNDDIGFLSSVERVGEDYGYGDFIKDIDTVVLGNRTYKKVLSMGYEFPHTDKETFVVTRTERPAQGNVSYYSGPLNTLIMNLKLKEGKQIFVDGGAYVVNELLRDDLIDEFYISIIPILLGDGIALFKPQRPKTTLTFVDAKTFESGLVQLHYQRNSQQGENT